MMGTSLVRIWPSFFTPPQIMKYRISTMISAAMAWGMPRDWATTSEVVKVEALMKKVEKMPMPNTKASGSHSLPQ